MTNELDMVQTSAVFLQTCTNFLYPPLRLSEEFMYMDFLSIYISTLQLFHTKVAKFNLLYFWGMNSLSIDSLYINANLVILNYCFKCFTSISIKIYIFSNPGRLCIC